MPPYSKVRTFLADTGGNVAIIVAFMVVPLLLASGGAIDLARQELIRLEMQGGLDRGVLAAAALAQTPPALSTLHEHLDTLPYSKDVQVQYDPDAGEGQIRAEAHYTMNTAFLTLAGINTLPVNVVSAASVGSQKLELSLMLDMSGSMQGNRIKNLKLAAQQFIDQILTEQSKDATTISIVPYAGEVNVGAAMFNALRGVRPVQDPTTVDPTYVPSCFDMKDNLYGTATVPTFQNATGLGTYTVYNYNRTDLRWWWCPGEESSITYFSNDAAYLKARVAALTLFDGTGSQVAMEWGYMLLNPDAKTIINAAIATGAMSPKFADRPASFSDPDTMKILVLMTDGLITPKFRPKDVKRSGDLEPQNNQGGNTEQWLKNICQSAKSKNIIIYTIGFEIKATDSAAAYMRDCASDPTKFFVATGTGIGNAFSLISTSIRKLRLTE